MTNPLDSISRHLFGTKSSTGTRTAATATATTATPKTTQVSCKKTASFITPFTIVEVLELVFCQLPPSSLAQVSLVCKRWYRISLRFMVDHTYWDDENPTKGRLVDRIHVKRVLHCTFRIPLRRAGGEGTDAGTTFQTTPSGDERWRSMLELWPKRKGPRSGHRQLRGKDREGTEDVLTEGRTTMPSLPTLACPIRNLYLAGHIHATNRLSSIIPYVSASLTKLDLRFQQMQTIDLPEILACPRLTFLHVEECRIATLFKDLDEEHENGLACLHDDPFEGTLLPLQSFILVSVQFDQQSLERLLRHCPEMHDFKVLYSAKSRRTIIRPYSEPELVQCLGFHCRNLDTIQVSQLNHDQSSQERLLMMVKELPRLRAVGIYDTDFTQPFFQGMVEQPCRITRLDVTQRPASPALAVHLSFNDRLLHEFLCLCPTLLHLYAYDVFLDVQHLDPTSALSGCGGLWACRSLKTLQLSFKSLDLDVPFQQRQRLVLDYIPRACPLLEHLQLDLFQVDFALESGLCLLSSSGSGLPRLETLGLGTNVIHSAKKSDIEWMRKQPPTLLQKGLRLLNPADPRSKRLSGGTDVAVGLAATEGALRKEIWPRWTRLRLYYDPQNKETNAKIQQLYELVASVRPGVDFKVVKSPKHDSELW